MTGKLEKFIERSLFASRWSLAPMYIGLAIALLLLLFSFLKELFECIMNISDFTQMQIILSCLSLIDISLAANLVLIVILSGFENFVSKMDLGDHKDIPEWQSAVDFSTLKLKLVSSMAAISGIQLLKTFMTIENTPVENLKWMVIIHGTFLLSGIFLAATDQISANAQRTKK
jgi:uncharacterized protein (TIGR00645 family)